MSAEETRQRLRASLVRMRGPHPWAMARRRVAQYADRAWVLTRMRLPQSASVPPFDGSPRFALLTVNFHTTRFLKLMLLTLSEQDALGLVHRIVVCDNGSRDGGAPFLRELSQRVSRLELVEHRRFLNHARGLRGCIRALDRAEADVPVGERSNLLLCCDTDVVFRNEETLAALAGTVIAHDAALVGEIRRGPNPRSDIQASFVLVRRDVYDRRDVVPFVNDGSPAYRMEQSVWRGGLNVIHFPSNHGGYVLHRGRSAVAATRRFAPSNPYAKVEATASYMGVPDGARIWDEIESRHTPLLDPGAEPELLDLLSSRFTRLGALVVEPE